MWGSDRPSEFLGHSNRMKKSYKPKMEIGSLNSNSHLAIIQSTNEESASNLYDSNFR